MSTNFTLFLCILWVGMIWVQCEPEAPTNNHGFLIKYEIQKTTFGSGIFALENVAKGTMIWKYMPGVNIRSFNNKEDFLEKLSQMSSYDEKRRVMTHVYPLGGTVNEILDDGDMWNHSENPNTCFGLDPSDISSGFAKRDIKAGEELFDDYGWYEWNYLPWFVELCEEFDVPKDYFVLKEQEKSNGRQLLHNCGL